MIAVESEGRDDGALDAGLYSLVLAVEGSPEPTVGALGARTFDASAYVYVGSARGPGGFARIARHRELARGERDVRRWHVDHLLGAPETTVAAVVRSADGEECVVAARHRSPVGDAAAGEPITGFGASDCGCDAHLYGFTELEDAVETAAAAHRATEGPWDAAWCNSYQDRTPPWG